jgi:general secretion pathway protein I
MKGWNNGKGSLRAGRSNLDGLPRRPVFGGISRNGTFPGPVPKERGFTLMEVVVALAILGIGLTVIIELFSGGLRLGRVSEEYTKALHHASLKMEEIVAQKTIEEGEGEGEFDKTFRWHVGVQKMNLLPVDKDTEFTLPAYFYHVRLHVLWKSGSKERSVSLETYKTLKSEADEKKS